MAVESLETFKTTILPRFSKRTRILGIDLGQKRIGLALSDFSFLIASPFKTLDRITFASVLEHLLKIIETEEIGALVIGLPLEMQGEEGRSAQSVRHFIYNFLKVKDIPVVFWDERLSTIAVTRTLLEADVSRKKRSEVVDKMAASFILQGFLESLPKKSENISRF